MRQSLTRHGFILLCALSVGAPARPTEAPAITPPSAGGASQQILAAAGASPGAPQPTELPAADRARIQNSFGKLPLTFIENQGQADERIAYYIQSPGHSLTFTHDGHALRLSRGKGEDTQAHTLKVELVDATPERIESLQRAQGIVSYFKGPRENWKTAIPTHSKIGYVQPWPGIDLSYDGTNGRLESIYTVAPHADPSQIKLRYSGQDSLTLDDDGNLVYTMSLGEIKETAPIAWQDIDGQRLPVETRFTLLDDRTVAFQVAEYDPEHALIIDPTLVYAGYIGGNVSDWAFGIAVDSAGNAYVTGVAVSTEATFPDTVGPDLTQNGDVDAFVAKVNAAGTALVYAGYIGGSGGDGGSGIAVDSADNAYVTGSTDSTDFPVLGGPDLTYNGVIDAFVAKVNPSGSALVYAGYIGGNGEDAGKGIAVDNTNNAYVTGYTWSNEASFPITVGPDLSHNGGNSDAFVAKVNPAGTALVYAGYIGGNLTDFGQGIAVDSTNNAYVTGYTASDEASFPVLGGPDLTFNLGNPDAFVAKVNPAGTALVYAGYIGSDGGDQGNGIAVDSAGNAYVIGFTTSDETSFPVLGGPDLTFNGGGLDAFVAKVNPSGSALVYAGYIGGNGQDEGYGIAVDSAGNAYVTGYTESTEATFPVTVGPDLTYNGFDAFVAKVNAAGTALVYAGYIGGDNLDIGYGIAVDSTGNAYVTGRTHSTQATFPATVGPDLTSNGNGDAFVAKIPATFPLVVLDSALSGTKTASAGPYSVGGTITYTVVLSNSGSAASPDNVGDEFTDVLPAGLTLVSANATGGTALANIGLNTVTWNGSVPAAGSVTITITATINTGTQGTTITNQGTFTFDADLTGDNESSGVTDDPGTGTAGDGTTIVVAAALDTLTKTVSGTFEPGSIVTYTIVITNTGDTASEDRVGDELTDILPSQLTLTGASSSTGTALATIGTNTVTWNGSVEADGNETITITITAILEPGNEGTTISNQASLSFDADGDGTNETTVLSDDPGTIAANDPTSFVAAAGSTGIPTTSELGLLLLAVGLAMLAGWKISHS